MRRWPCDVCAGPVITVGEIYVVCPKAHVHHVCVDCQIQMYGGKYLGTAVPKQDRTGANYLVTKQGRCPKEISDADITMWALRGRKPTPGSTSAVQAWDDLPSGPI